MVSSLGEERRKVCLFCLNAFETYDVNQKCCSSLCEIDYKAKLDSRKQKDDSFKEQIWELMSDPDEEYGWDFDNGYPLDPGDDGDDE